MRYSVVAIVALILVSNCKADTFQVRRDLTYKQGDGYVDVLLGEKMVARYVYKNTPKPYIYPLLTASGEHITAAPIETDTSAHHRSCWVGFANVNGVDFWTEGDKSGKIVQTNIAFDSASIGYWSIHTLNDWIGPNGKKIAQDERRITFLACDKGLIISTLIELQAGFSELKFGDNKGGFFALRFADWLNLKSGGHALNSESLKDAGCSGKRARWCDFSGKINGNVCGITIFDSPENHNYPTYWFVSDDGLICANPFCGESLTDDEKNNSSLTIPAKGTTKFLYIVLIHDGELDAKAINDIAEQLVPKGSRNQRGVFIPPYIAK